MNHWSERPRCPGSATRLWRSEMTISTSPTFRVRWNWVRRKAMRSTWEVVVVVPRPPAVAAVAVAVASYSRQTARAAGTKCPSGPTRPFDSLTWNFYASSKFLQFECTSIGFFAPRVGQNFSPNPLFLNELSARPTRAACSSSLWSASAGVCRPRASSKSASLPSDWTQK